jgi:hypothetical protein
MAESPAYPGAPRWLKMFGIVVLVVLLFLVIVGHIVFGGRGLHVIHGEHATTPDHRATHTEGEP